MVKKNINGNGESPDIFHGQKVIYPVSFEMKSVMVFTDNDSDNRERLEQVFMDQKVDFRYVAKKASSKGAYMSYTYNITLTSKKQLDVLYRALKTVKGLKFAL